MTKLIQQSLKTEKGSSSIMRKSILTSMLSIFFILTILVFFINISSADLSNGGSTGVNYFQIRQLLNDSITTLNYASVTYQPSTFDKISAGKSYESYIWYHYYTDDWNNKNSNANVTSCSLKVLYSKDNGNTLVTLLNVTLIGTLDDGRYFVRLNPKESYYTYATCTFASATARNNAGLEMPMDFSIVTPTPECFACQYFNWLNDQVKLTKAVTLSDYTTRNVRYIKGLVGIFYEFIIISFWVLMIILLLLAVGLIFYAVWWIYSWLVKNVKV